MRDMRAGPVPKGKNLPTGKRRGRPRGSKAGVKNTGGGLPFFNPFGGKGKK